MMIIALPLLVSLTVTPEALGEEIGPQVQVLEELLRSGKLSPEEAVVEYCAQESADKQMDAFCACPEVAVEVLRQRLEAELIN